MREPLDPSLSSLHHLAAAMHLPPSLSLSLHSNPPHHCKRLGLSLAVPPLPATSSALCFVLLPPARRASESHGSCRPVSVLPRAAVHVRVRYSSGRLQPQGSTWSEISGEVSPPSRLTWSQEGLSGSLLLPILRIRSCSRSRATALVPFGTVFRIF
jgi:hypothetical protein